MKFTGVILSGGQSKRMGKDKGLLEIEGKTFIEYQIETLSEFCDEIVISTNNSEYTKFNYPIIEDEIKDIGPLGGLYSVFNNYKRENYIVLSCDTPFVSKDVISILISAYTEENKLVNAQYNGKSHPLIGIYPLGSFEKMKEHIQEKNYRMMNLLKDCEGKLIEFNSYEGIVEKTFMNLNHWEDYNLFKK